MSRSTFGAPGLGSPSARTTASALWRFSERNRERATTVNQLLLGSVILALAFVVVITDFSGDRGLFFGGVVLAFVLTGMALLVPWNAYPAGWTAIIPLADIVAIALIRQSSPASGLGLLWLFPVIWLSSSLGMIGLLSSIVASSAGLWLTVLADGSTSLSYGTLLLQLAIVAAAWLSYLTARRAAAQRALLDKQARLLSRALERAVRQEQSVTEVLDAVDFGVIRIGTDNSVAVANEAHGRLQQALSVTDDEDAVVPAYAADGVTALVPDELPLERARRGEAFDDVLVWFGEPSGERQALRITARRIRGMSGDDVGAVLISRDVTREVLALRARDNLVASVSHELRTPLTSILGYLELALDDPEVPASARKGLEVAERNAERLLKIVGDILAASSASTSSVDLTISPKEMDVAAIAESAAEAIQPRASDRGIAIDTSGLEPARAWVDPLRIRQVIDNLISNAVKYNREGGTTTIGSTTDGDSTWVVVRDSGVGMSHEEMGGLFERFYRAGTTSRMRKGTGLGLAISRDIVRAHGGDITVKSTPGVGSTFIVRLPADRGAATPAPRVPARVLDTQAIKTLMPTPAADGRRTP